MKISYNWLTNYLRTNYNLNKISDIITDLGLEVQSITKVVKCNMDKIIIGRILKLEKHPYNNYYNVLKIDIGKNNITIINNIINNIKYGTRTLIATDGSYITDIKGNNNLIKTKIIKNILSEGIFCHYNKLELFNNFIEGFMEIKTSLNPGVTAQEIFPRQKDYIIDIGITPNRSDAMSHYGVARDLFIAIKLIGKKVLFKKPIINNFNKNVIYNKLNIYIESHKHCIRYSGCFLYNIKIEQSPLWLQNTLINIGMTPINNIIDITNFISYELGQPIFAYDAGKIIGNNLIIKKVITKIGHKFKKNDLIISDDINIISLAGIFCEKYFDISKYTNYVFLESAYFDPINIRKSSKIHNIITDSTFRFERGTDINNTVYSLKRAIYLIQHITSNKIIYSNILDVKSILFNNNIDIYIYYKKIYDILGINIYKKYIKIILYLLDIKILFDDKYKLRLQIPKFRTDIFRDIDIIEEILRIYGYNNIIFSDELQFKVKINNIMYEPYWVEYVINFLISKGFYEIINISFINSKYKQIMSHLANDLIKIIYPLNKELTILRPTLLFSLLERIQYNIYRNNKNLKFFELGKYYRMCHTKYLEKTNMSIIITTDKQSTTNMFYSENYYSFFYLKGLIESILNILGISNYHQKTSEDNFLEYKLLIMVENKILVQLGKVKKYITKYFNIKQEVFFAEIDWELLSFVTVLKEQSCLEPSKYPSIRRDLSILIDKHILFEDIYITLKSIGEKILKKIKLFDIYQGKQIPLGKTSYSISFYLEDQDTTLTNIRVNNLMNKIIKILHNKFGASIR